jgi:hypothetical protein
MNFGHGHRPTDKSLRAAVDRRLGDIFCGRKLVLRRGQGQGSAESTSMQNEGRGEEGGLDNKSRVCEDPKLVC